MELLIVAVVFYLVGKNSESLGGKNNNRIKFLANFAATVLFIIFLMALMKYGLSYLLIESFGNSKFYQLAGMVFIWGGYMLRVSAMGEIKTGSPYSDIFYAYKNFPYKDSIFQSSKIIICDVFGLVLFITWIVK